MKFEDIISNMVDELQRARERILELGDFSDNSITPDEELVSDIDTSIERIHDVVNVKNRMLTIAYNAICLGQLDEIFDKEELLNELGCTEEEYDEIME